MKKEKINLVFVIFFGIFLFVVTYQVVMQCLEMGHTDYNYHAELAGLFKESGLFSLLLQIGYPLWAVLVGAISACFRAPIAEASAIVTGGLNAASYVIVYSFLKKDNEDNSFWIAVLSCALLLLGPFHISWYYKYVYYGQGIPNIWHNPGAICVRPFAIVTFLLIIRLLKNYEEGEPIRRRDWLFLIVGLIFCNLAKPSFMQIIIPGLGIYLIYMLFATKGKALLFSIKMASAFIPGVCLLLWQAWISFEVSDAANGGLELIWFDSMRAAFPNFFFSLLLGYLFPVYVIITNPGISKERDIKLTFFVWLSGFFEAGMLAETGTRRGDFNFSWGHLLAMFLVYLITFQYFLRYNRDYCYDSKRQQFIAGIGWGIFILQLYIGIYYISTFFN